MKHLTVIYNGQTVYDADVSTYAFTEQGDTITLKAGPGGQSSGGTLGGLMPAIGQIGEQFAAAQKRKTAQHGAALKAGTEPPLADEVLA